ncbi:right-handed parallel beta-helix repeat-containing protein [Marinobacter fonticola]|uniref:right-handed parallel beta-helix repeat-containing protein n=1 Tax=Marinobacter fonticola TaxID=2603215 RepID=UPI0011E815B7|nr:right-handed parallel beta-helix repeat-containing protein [Marinobacter fonticola]
MSGRNMWGRCWAGLLTSLCLALPQLALANDGAACDRQVKPGENVGMVLNGLPQDDSHQTVCLAAGEFQLDGMLHLERSNVTLRGAGPDATTLRLREGVSSPVLVLGDVHHQEPDMTVRNVTVEDLAIRGRANAGEEFNSERPYLSNSALIVRRGENIELTDLDIRDCRSACVLTEYHSSDVRIADNVIAGAKWDGISLNRAGPTRVVGNIVRDNTAAGITVEYLNNSEISNNVVTDNGSHGIYLADAEHNRFADNRIAGNAEAGVFLTCSVRHRDPVLCWDNSFSRDNVFTNNTFENNQFGYQVAVDKAANCLHSETPPNVSRGDSFLASPNQEPAWEEFGRCIAYDGSRTLQQVSSGD